MPFISVQMLAGRTAEQKRALIAALAEGAVSALGVRPEQVRVLLTEVPAEHWGVGARSMAEIEAEKGAG